MKPTLPMRSTELAKRPLTLAAAAHREPLLQQQRSGRGPLQVLQSTRAPAQLSLFPPPHNAR